MERIGGIALVIHLAVDAPDGSMDQFHPRAEPGGVAARERQILSVHFDAEHPRRGMPVCEVGHGVSHVGTEVDDHGVRAERHGGPVERFEEGVLEGPDILPGPAEHGGAA